MTASELRIGNWVMCQYRGEYKPHAIKSIYFNDEEKLYFVELDNGFQCNVNGISPIELTDELLEKCGYLKSRDGYFYHKQHCFCDIAQWKEGDYHLYDGCNCLLSCKINGLHHLQNIVFALNGEELNIEL